MTMPGSDGLRETIDEAVGHFVHSPPIVDAVERAVRAWEAKRAPLGEAAREVVAPHTGQRAWVAPADEERTFECRQSAEPRLTWIGPYQGLPLLQICEDCGSVVVNEKAHIRFHAILGDHGRAAAMLLVTHIAPGVHDRYDVKERFDAKRNENNWSREAFAEVVGESGSETE